MHKCAAVCSTVIALALTACDGSSDGNKVPQTPETAKEVEAPKTELSTSGPVEPQKTVIASGLKHPWDMAFLSKDNVLVTEKDGALKHIDLRTGTQKVVSGFPEDLDNMRRDDPRDNSGLFGIALDPSYANTGWIYVAYSAGDETGTVLKVIRGRLSEDALVDVETILTVPPPSTDRFHYGGGLVFGTDGTLFVTAGERIFDEIDQPDLPVAQDPRDGRGKIYRIHPDGTIPQDNPDFGDGAVPGMVATGIRAAQGLTRHPETGDIWFSEHGSIQGDEINLLKPGANYGWPNRTDGKYRNPDYVPPELDRDFSRPAWSWAETVAPTGLTFYTGTEFPSWSGKLFVAGLSRGSLWRLTVDGEKISAAQKLFEADPVRLRNVKQGPDGQLYILTDEPDGKIILIEPASAE